MPTCAGCHRPITSSYITALNRTWHPGCFVCAGCGRPIEQQSFSTHANQPYHETCYHERFSPRCAACGQPIAGPVTTALGKTWHTEHFVCAEGRHPIHGQSFYEHEGQVYCEAHYWQRFGKRCAIGGEIMRDKWVINGWGDAYCEHHSAGAPACYSCHRPICSGLTGGGVRYSDGRTVCNRCRNTAVDKSPAGQPILGQVRAGLARAGLDLGSARTPLRLVDQAELTRLSTKRYTKQPAGMACHESLTQNGQVIERTVKEILVLHGLPAEHFAAIAAHELTHSYLFLHAFPELVPAVEEGLCELGAYLWLKQQGTVEAAYRIKLMMESDDPIYGRGFQAARRGLEQVGIARILDYAFQRRRFPT